VRGQPSDRGGLKNRTEQNRTEPGLLNAEASITVPTASFDLVSRDTLTLLVIDAAWRDLH